MKRDPEARGMWPQGANSQPAKPINHCRQCGAQYSGTSHVCRRPR